MNVTFHQSYVEVQRAPGDPRAGSESAFWVTLRRHLNGEVGGHCLSCPGQWIKKLMWKDGHLVDDSQYYVRERKVMTDATGRHLWAIEDGYYALRQVHWDYNAGKTVCLNLTHLAPSGDVSR